MANPAMLCVWLMLSFVLLQLQAHGSVGCKEEERIALLRLRDAFKYPNGTTALPSWGDEEEKGCCMWERVSCDQSNHHVIQLSLANLRGPDSNNYFFLNTSLFLPFRELQNLSLDGNRIRGFHEVLNLSKLQVLDLSFNWFHEIPRLGLLHSLKILIMGLNHISTWSHFEELTTLKHLELLDFGLNYLSGKIPLSLGSLTSLKFLTFIDNRLINGIDGALCKLKNLRELDLQWNRFEGRIPSCLGNLTSLRFLTLRSNYFTGTLHSTLFSSMNSLVYLSLSFNYFEGSFLFNSSFGNNSKLEIFELENLNNTLIVNTENPPWMPQSHIKIFRLSNCKLNDEPAGGNLPSFLLKQRELRLLNLSHTGVREILPTWLLINNSNMEALDLAGNFLTGPFTYNHQSSNEDLFWLDVSMNQIQGVLPYSIGVFFPSLIYLDMSTNAIQGSIPPSMGELKILKLLDLSNNNLSGELSEEFVQGCNNLMILKLANNNLQGQVLPTNSNLSSLEYLRLANNRFSGELSRGLLNSMSLELLDLSNNSITGKIPDWIGYLSNHKSIVLSDNSLQGHIPMSFCHVKELSFVDLSKNKLTETIPACLNVSSLRYLHLHGNGFTGFVPKVLSQTSSLVTLDMRGNNLSGRLPTWISSLSNLRFLLLGGNQLEGSIPSQLCDLKNVSMLDLSSNNISSFLPSCLHNVLFGSKRTFDAMLLEPNEYGWGFLLGFGTYPYESRLQIVPFLQYNYESSDEKEEVEFVTKSRSES